MLKKMAMIAVSATFATVTLAAHPNKSTRKKESTAPQENPPIVLATPNHQSNAETDKADTRSDPPHTNTAVPDPNWFLFGIGCVTCVVISWQSWETRKAANAAHRQAGIMGDTAQRQLRAYVSVNSAVLTFPQPEVPRVRVVFKNFGQTPAYDLYGWIHTWLADYPLNEALPIPTDDVRMGKQDLGPGAVTDFVAPEKPPIQGDDLRNLGSPRCTLFVYGEVHYRDVFRTWQFTRYRFMFGGAGACTRYSYQGRGKGLGSRSRQRRK